MTLVAVNYVAVLVAAIATMALGFVWYGPLFGKPWMKLSGMTKEKMEASKDQMPKIYGLGFLFQLLMAYVIAQFVAALGATTAMEGAMVGFWGWLGFTATTMVTQVLWGDQPVKLYEINVGYQLVAMAVMGAIFAVWV